jgi:hypothetical protein
MTREQYKIEALKFLNKEFIEAVRFPELLKQMAVEFFMKSASCSPAVLNSDIANETRRRLKELDDTGKTD